MCFSKGIVHSFMDIDVFELGVSSDVVGSRGTEAIYTVSVDAALISSL